MGKEHTRVKNHLIRVAVIVVATVAVVLLLEGLSLFQRPENMLYDSRMVRTAPFHRPSDEIAVILLDQDSLDWAQQEFGWSWPWPRSAYGDIVSYFNLGGAASVAFDVLWKLILQGLKSCPQKIRCIYQSGFIINPILHQKIQDSRLRSIYHN